MTLLNWFTELPNYERIIIYVLGTVIVLCVLGTINKKQ
jgi:hypothetical protein